MIHKRLALPAGFRNLCVAVCGLLFLLTGILRASAQAGSITFTSDTAIAAGSTAYENYDVTVRNCTLTVDGAHTFHRLIVESNGIVTHSSGVSGQYLNVTTDVSIVAGSRLSADGRGSAAQLGTGAGASTPSGYGNGASHGGEGGRGAFWQTIPADAYGSLTQPIALGSGGGRSDGGSGGGAIRLTVAGTLTVNGSISANGADANPDAGGGSGGSLWITTGTLTGTGVIQANGGSVTNGGGGGSGGRVAVYATTNQIPMRNLQAFGGLGWQPGSVRYAAGAGTVLLKVGAAIADVIVDNNLNVGGNTTFEDAVTLAANLVVRNGGSVGPPLLAAPFDNPNFHLTVQGNVTVEYGGRFSADGRGFGAALGLGAGASTPSGYGNGASHGGEGGRGAVWQTLAANPYGSLTQPTDMGSGGGRTDGGAGGGAIRLTVTGDLMLEGIISANGADANPDAGGGSGGSVWISAGTFSGEGVVSANGGSVTNGGGGGGGGRIAVYYNSSSFLGDVQAWGGLGWQPSGARYAAGAGTILLKDNDLTLGDVIIDNNDNQGWSTTFAGNVTLAANLRVRRGGIVSPRFGAAGLHLTVQGSAAVEGSGRISADGRGFGAELGSGAGISTPSGYGNGASHGGEGGRGAVWQTLAANSYGSITQPVDLGSGGGRTDGGAGGGAIRLTVAGTLTVNGFVSANGSPGAPDAGSGSGGSLWISAGTLAGEGRIQVNGGSVTNGGGGGGGGRVAVYATTNQMSTRNLQAYGGLGWQPGGARYAAGAGTVFLKVGVAVGDAIVDNNLNLGWATQFNGVQNNAFNLVVRRAGIVSTQFGQTGAHLTFTNVTVAGGGYISVNGRGSIAETGTGAGATTPSGYGNGASYGGEGGQGYNLQTPPAEPYGSIIQPVDLGSGGGRSDGGTGGGALRLTATGTLTVNGIISANGIAGHPDAGSGSGGSLWIEAATVTGSGLIQANGGSTTNPNGGGGGGGGGRIALLSPNRTLPLTNVTASGGTGWNGSSLSNGCPGTIYTGTIWSISGTITLESAVNPQQPVTIELRSQTRCIYRVTLTLPANGSFTLPNILPDQYTLAVKGAKWLRTTLPVDTRSGNVTGLNVFLRGGDANNDNIVDIADLLFLIGAYNKQSGQTGFVEGADITCNGVVDISDLLVLIRNYNQIGDL